MAIRAYHHFSLNRSFWHVFVGFMVLFVPLVGLVSFSYIGRIEFTTTLLDFSVSVVRLGVALIIATILAWVLVVVLVRGKTAGPSIAIFDVVQSLPTFTILPIAVHYWGVSTPTIIGFLVITIIWPIIFSIVSSLKQVERSRVEAVEVSRIRGLNYIRYYLFPLTTPGIMTGVIIGLGDGWEALIATEIILHTSTGLGPFFQSFADNSRMTLFGVLVFLSIIFAINKFVWLPLLERSHDLIE